MRLVRRVLGRHRPRSGSAGTVAELLRPRSVHAHARRPTSASIRRRPPENLGDAAPPSLGVPAQPSTVAPLMGRRLAPLTLDTLPDLPDPCRQCVVWELDPVAAAARPRRATPRSRRRPGSPQRCWSGARAAGSPTSTTTPPGFVLYAPPTFVPRSLAFPTSPVSADAVLLMTARVLPEYTGGGLARMLIQAAAKDLTRRGVRAVEAFG